MKEEKKQKIRELIEKLAGFSDEQRETIVSKIGLMNPEGHVFSPRNQMLVYLQAGNSSVSILAGFRQWQKHGRSVKKGSKGYLICIPSVVPKSDKPEDEELLEPFFFWKYVFDISQTQPISSQKEEGVAA